MDANRIFKVLLEKQAIILTAELNRTFDDVGFDKSAYFSCYMSIKDYLISYPIPREIMDAFLSGEDSLVMASDDFFQSANAYDVRIIESFFESRYHLTGFRGDIRDGLTDYEEMCWCDQYLYGGIA